MPPISGTPSPTLRPNKRDLAILEALHRKGYLTASLIQAQFWRASKGGRFGVVKDCQRRLRQLTTAGLIRYLEPFIRYPEGKKPRIYTLNQGGARLLADHHLDPAAIAWKPTSAEHNAVFLHHILMVNQVWLAFELACDATGVVLDAWRTDRQLKKAGPPDYITLTTPNGQQQNAAVIPDSIFLVQDAAHDREALFFLEVDLGHVTLAPSDSERRSWRRKISIYLEYLRSAAYRQRYGEQRAVVLTVTTSAGRARNMRHVSENAGADRRFFFTTFDHLTPEAALRGTIWQRATLEGTYALLG